MKITLDIAHLLHTQHAQGAYKKLLEHVEAPFFETLLHHTRGNLTQAAKIAGINRKTLNNKLQRYGLSVTRQVKKDPINTR